MNTTAIGTKPAIPKLSRDIASSPIKASPTTHIHPTTPTPGTSALRRFFSLPKSKTDIFARLTRALVIPFAIIATTPAWIVVNELLMFTGRIPQPVLPKKDKDCDTRRSFLRNEPKEEDLRSLNQALLGDSGLSADKVRQKVDGECGSAAELIAISQTNEPRQRLEKSLQILRIGEFKGEPVAGIKVTLGGETVIVTGFRFKDCPTGEGAPRILMNALNEILVNQNSCALAYMSGLSNLSTGKKHYTIPVIALSKKDLERIITQAPPDSIIKLATYPTLNGYMSSMTDKFKELDEYTVSSNNLYHQHIYAKMGHKYENGELKVIVKDGLSPQSHELSLDQINGEMAWISVPAEMVTILNKRNVAIWFLAGNIVLITIIVPRNKKSHK